MNFFPHASQKATGKNCETKQDGLHMETVVNYQVLAFSAPLECTWHFEVLLVLLVCSHLNCIRHWCEFTLVPFKVFLVLHLPAKYQATLLSNRHTQTQTHPLILFSKQCIWPQWVEIQTIRLHLKYEKYQNSTLKKVYSFNQMVYKIHFGVK